MSGNNGTLLLKITEENSPDYFENKLTNIGLVSITNLILLSRLSKMLLFSRITKIKNKKFAIESIENLFEIASSNIIRICLPTIRMFYKDSKFSKCIHTISWNWILKWFFTNSFWSFTSSGYHFPKLKNLWRFPIQKAVYFEICLSSPYTKQFVERTAACIRYKYSNSCLQSSYVRIRNVFSWGKGKDGRKNQFPFRNDPTRKNMKIHDRGRIARCPYANIRLLLVKWICSTQCYRALSYWFTVFICNPTLFVAEGR